MRKQKGMRHPWPGASAWVTACVCAMAALMSGCGGDGSRYPPSAPTAPAAAPAPTVAYAAKAFEFHWPAVSGATYYRLGEDPGNTGSFATLADNIATTSHAVRNLVLTQPPAAWRYALQACNALGCSPWSAPVAPDATRAIGYFKAASAGGQSLGLSVALAPDGNTLAAGSANSVELFSRSAGRWHAVQTLALGVNSAPELALANDGTLLVGRPGEDEGLVRVYSRDVSGQWVLVDTWHSQAPQANGEFGAAVSLSRDASLAVVGELRFPAGSGRFHVYRRTAGAWALEQTVLPDHVTMGGLFGAQAKLSADGSTIVVGAQYEDSGLPGDETDTSLNAAGAAFVYRVDAGSGLWTKRAYLKAPVPQADAWFGAGTAISSDGDVVVVGAPNSSLSGQLRAGAAHVFTAQAGGYVHTQAVLAPTPAAEARLGGWGMALSDSGVLVLGSMNDLSAGTGVGADPSPAGLTNAGAVHLYRLAGGAFAHQAYVKASNTDASDVFGFDVDVSADGQTLAVGARGESSAATGIGGETADNSAANRGAVYLY